MWTPLVMVRGDSRTFTLPLEWQGAVLDLTGATVSFSVDGLFTKTTADGITVTTPASGVIAVAVEPDDTSGVGITHGRLTRRFDVEAAYPDGTVRTPLRGSFVLLPDVT